MIFKLLLPILFPSWRFFRSIGPSPRIDFSFISGSQSEPREWIPLNNLPQTISVFSSITKLFYNPDWNRQLYLNTCAEHLCETYEEFHEQEIGRQLLSIIAQHKIKVPEQSTHVKFRIRTLESDLQSQLVKNQPVQESLVFVSKLILLTAEGAPQ